MAEMIEKSDRAERLEVGTCQTPLARDSKTV